MTAAFGGSLKSANFTVLTSWSESSGVVRPVRFKLSDDRTTLSVTGPPSGEVYPPGPGWLYVVADGVPSVGKKLLIGDGQGPPVDEGAIEK